MDTISTPHNQSVMTDEWNKQALIEALKQIQNETRRLKKEQVSAQTIAKLAENVRRLASILEISGVKPSIIEWHEADSRP